MTFATGTDLYARHVGRYTDALAAAFVEWAGVRAGDEALDVGCGPGSVVAALADRLGPAHVAAVEPSEPFAALARERVPGADIRTASAEALPFPDGAFDVVLSQLVVNFMDDAPAGVRDARRAELESLWTDAGLTDVETGDAVVSARYEDFDDYWAPFTSGLAPSGAYCASLPPDAQRDLRNACFRRLGRPAGAFELDARARLVEGSV